MGKAQSKRSCDITTEPSKEIQEGTGELKKIDESLINENEASVSDKRDKYANEPLLTSRFLACIILGQRK